MTISLSLLRAGQSERVQLDKIRAAIGAAAAAIEQAKRTRRHAEEVRAAIVADLQKAITESRPEYTFDAYTDGDGREGRLSANELRITDLAWLFGAEVLADQVMKRLEASGRLGTERAAQRATRLEKLTRELEALELDEEKETLRLEALGHVVIRRADARPELVLALWGENAAPAEGAS